MKKYRVLAVHQGKRDEPGACELYRVTTPLAYLAKTQAWECKWTPFQLFHEDFLKIDPEQGCQIIANNFDLVVWARTSLYGKEEAFSSGAWTVQELRRLGVKQIYEVDDDYTEENRIVLKGGHAMEFASWCDAVTVTTPYLAETMRQRTGRPTYVIPNMLDPEFWGRPPEIELPQDRIRIVLSGSTTHKDDWRVLGGVLQGIAADYPHVQFLIGGYSEDHFDYLKGIPNAEYMPVMPYIYYIDLIKNADIVLCPVIPDDKFNLGKSPIKATEGQGATRLVDGKPVGAAVIATDNPVYRLAIPNDKVGVLTQHTSEAWDSAIRSLIKDYDRRRQLQVEGYKFVNKKFNLKTGWMEWARTYRRVIDKHINTQKIDYVQSYAAYRESLSLPNGATG